VTRPKASGAVGLIDATADPVVSEERACSSEATRPTVSGLRSERDAAIRRAVVRVRESLAELDALLDGEGLPKRQAPRKRSTPAPTVVPSTEAVGVMRRRLRTLGVRA
jgi:hypothetical protein